MYKLKINAFLSEYLRNGGHFKTQLHPNPQKKDNNVKYDTMLKKILTT